MDRVLVRLAYAMNQNSHVNDRSWIKLKIKVETLGDLEIGTPSVPNYKSFQEFWRVKPSQSLTKIIERNIKTYDIK